MAEPVIVEVRARQLLDCKTRPMVEVEIVTDGGHCGRGAAPTGSSVGMHEALVLRDGSEEYGGLSVHGAVKNVLDIIGPALIGVPVFDQRRIDEIMIDLDGTDQKSRLGGNAIYSTSIAALRAASHAAGVPVYEHVARGPLRHIPVPCFNVVNGGRYDGVVQPFNEFLLVPRGAETIEQAVEIAVRTFAALGPVITSFSGAAARTGASYGYVAPSPDPREVLILMLSAAEETGCLDEVAVALDCASSEMYDAETATYHLLGDRVGRSELIDYTDALSREFDLVFVEDLLDENDWGGFRDATARLDRTMVLADDLTVTNPRMIRRAVEENAMDGFILKPNQVGTITEALDAFDYATARGLHAIPSGRSGGVIDDIVMDLALGLQVPFQKNGAPRSGERIEKLNFLMRAADRMGVRNTADLGLLAKPMRRAPATCEAGS